MGEVVALRELQTLDERAVIRTLEVLRNRVAERFPTRGLTKTASHLLDVSRVAAMEAAQLREPYWGMRLVPIVAIAGAFAGFGVLYRFFSVILDQKIGLAEFTQGLEATLNIILIAGIAIGFIFAAGEPQEANGGAERPLPAARHQPRYRHASAHQGSGSDRGQGAHQLLAIA